MKVVVVLAAERAKRFLKTIYAGGVELLIFSEVFDFYGNISGHEEPVKCEL